MAEAIPVFCDCGRGVITSILMPSMKQLLIFVGIVLCTAHCHAQQFSQYYTGTLFDSFEHPSRSAFLPDTSRNYAFNFLIPNFNFNANLQLKGNTQSVLVHGLFGGAIDYSALQPGRGQVNTGNFNTNTYALMFKFYDTDGGREEFGLFAGQKAEGKGIFSDETLGLLNGGSIFPGNIYDNVLNDSYHIQIYNTIGLTYREAVTEQVAVGFKVAFLMGVTTESLHVIDSHLSLNRIAGSETLALKGSYQLSKGPGPRDGRNFLPLTLSPGAQISAGTSFITDDHLILQANIQDLGFIHWYSGSFGGNFDQTVSLSGLSTLPFKKQVDNLYGSVYQAFRTARDYQGFNTPTDGRLELSIAKSYPLADEGRLAYVPALIASKQLFEDGLALAMVNRLRFRDINISATASYDNQQVFNAGMQLMLQSHNVEFFIGSDRLLHTISFAQAVSSPNLFVNQAYTGGNIFMGFSLKFGQIIETPTNAVNIPDGQRAFLGRLWGRLFKRYR